jgi:hypothetical protein
MRGGGWALRGLAIVVLVTAALLASSLSGWRSSRVATRAPDGGAPADDVASVAGARAACAAAEPSLRAQLLAHDEVLVHCEPPDAASPPCVTEALFASSPLFALPANGTARRADPRAQCRARPTYADWPLTGSPRLVGPSPIVALVGALPAGARVAFVGASVMQQIYAAALCALAAHGLDGTVGRRWRRWGWGHYSADNGGCPRVSFDAGAYAHPRELYARVRAEGCAARGDGLARLLRSVDVALVGYSPQHYCGMLGWWEADLRAMLPQLAAFASRAGKAVVLVEPSADHFPRGSYWALGGGRADDAGGPPPTARCCGAVAARYAHDNFVWYAARALRALRDELAPGLAVLGAYNATLPLHAHHKADACSYAQRKVRGVAPPIAADARGAALRVRGCCDCLHYCYSPARYDALYFAPLARALRGGSG